MTDIYFGIYPNAFIDVILCLSFITCLVLLWNGYFAASKIIMLICVCLGLTINSSTEGPIAGNQFLWIPIISVAFIFYKLSQWKYILFHFSVCACSIIFLEYTDYSLLMTDSKLPENVYVNYLICLIVSNLLVCFYIFYLVLVNEKSERKMILFNKNLKEINTKLLKANRELDSFVYKTSHDLRAPLTSLLGLVDLAQKEENLSSIKEYLKLKERTIHKLDNYIQDILHVSRNSRLGLDIQKIDFDGMIKSILDKMAYMENAINIIKKVNVHGEYDFYSDPSRIEIILSNLISNSIRYADTYKNPPYVEIDIHLIPDKAIINVRDNGQGIKAEYLDKVFEIFFRANDRNNGSGLGLFIVKETIQKLKGEVKINSVYREYTEITVTLPDLNV